MKKTILSSILIIFLMISSVFAEEDKKYGKELTLKKVTKVSDIFNNPEKFEGKKVLVEGTIVAVCEHRGCWMEIKGEEPSQKIRVKGNEGEVSFPLTAIGSKAKAEGEITVIELSKEQVIAMQKHEAEMAKKEFDPSSVKEGRTMFMIKLHGAVIEE